VIKLNLGGGAKWSETGWTNLDIDLGHDLRKENPLPYPDNSVDTIYSSHAIEHMTPEEARRLLVECHRVLMPTRVMRIVVPDCEKFAKAWSGDDPQFFKGNYCLTPHFRDMRQCFLEMGGNPTDLNKPSIIHHYFFWDRWTMTWLLALAGFDTVFDLSFSRSFIDEFHKVAEIEPGSGMPLNGFDNPLTESISLYVEAFKKSSEPRNE
jgi:SAM-dependent methyltransferase